MNFTQLLDAVLRLARLLDTPKDIAMLAPLINASINPNAVMAFVVCIFSFPSITTYAPRPSNLLRLAPVANKTSAPLYTARLS